MKAKMNDLYKESLPLSDALKREKLEFSVLQFLNLKCPVFRFGLSGGFHFILRFFQYSVFGFD